MRKKMLVPKLRFPEFRDAGEWGSFPLSNFVAALDAGVSVNSGDRPAISNEVGILKTSCVTNGVFEPLENKVVSKENEIKRLKEPVCGNTIIISRMNTPALVGANAYVTASIKNLFLPDRLWAAKPKTGTSMRFIATILGSVKGRTTLSEMATGTSGSMKNITKTDVFTLQLLAPSLPEQQKIADCLSSIDALITAHNQKLDALKAHKKGLMQQLFPAAGETVPKLRFPKFRDAGAWCISTIEEIGSIASGGTPSRSKPEYWDGDIPWVSTTLIDFNKIKISNEFITKIGLKNSSAKIFAEGTILMAMYGQGKTRGKVALLGIKAAINQACAAITLKKGMSRKFVFQNLAARYDEIRDISNQGGQMNLSAALIKKMPFIYPDLESGEQQKIADCLSSIDKLLTAQTKKIDALKAYKKGLQQQLFPSTDEVGA